MSNLQAAPLLEPGSFNWVFLIEYITIGLLALFFLFYWNRLLATVISWIIRLYTWHKFRVYVDIGALQISFLAGRIFFKSIRYHGDNETILVHGGFITWRYWLRRTQQPPVFDPSYSKNKPTRQTSNNSSDISDDQTEVADEEGSYTASVNEHLPCRISAKVWGVEAYIYNRGPAYGWILDAIEKKNAAKDKTQHQSEKSTFHYEHLPSDSVTPVATTSDDSSDPAPSKAGPSLHGSRTNNSYLSDGGHKSLDPALAPPAFLRMLPVFVECNTAAAVLGNENTKSIITAKIDSASGKFNADKSGRLDIFKIVMDFEVEKPVIQMKPNADYKRPQLAEAVALKEMEHHNTTRKSEMMDDASLSSTSLEAPSTAAESKNTLFNRLKYHPLLTKLHLQARKSTESIATYPLKARATDDLPNIQSHLPGQGRWQGLRRYLDEQVQDEHEEWDAVEYANSTTIAELDRIGFKFFWDIPGRVPERPLGSPDGDEVNRDPPPEYGMELAVYGGQVNYGPWADRHRVILQEIFFPATYVDAVPMAKLKIGDTRMNTVFTLFLSIEQETTLRIPFREASKDWRWKGRAKNLSRQDQPSNAKHPRSRRSKSHQTGGPKTVRPFAWFDLTIAPNTTINYRQDMYAMSKGYTNKLSVDANDVRIFSSLNHAMLWQSPKIRLNADLSYPLAWNALREWIFDISISNLDLFLLRDHTFLLMDLIDDWTRGPLPDFYTFIPYRYLLKVHFDDFKLWLNVNDANIVNYSDDVDDNEFVILFGKTLDSDLTIPLDRFRPAHNDITFDVIAEHLGFELRLPPKNTLHSLLANKRVAQLPRVLLNGSYNYWSTVEPGLTETLCMKIIGTGLDIQFYGFLGRMLAKVKENYFGEDMHFKTLEEYQAMRQQNFVTSHADQPLTKANDLDVILDITAENANIMLPAGLYQADEHLLLQVESADIDLRVNNYFLEMMVSSSPVSVSCRSRDPLHSGNQPGLTGTQMFIDGVEVYGHRLFGLGPTEPSYVSKWDVKAGDITGECSIDFLAKAAAAGQALALSFPDHENALPLPHLAIIHDATFVRFYCSFIRLWFPVASQAFVLETRTINGTFDDFAGKLFSQRLKLFVPEVTIACAESRMRSRNVEAHAGLATTYAYLRTSIIFNMVQRSKAFEQERSLQQEHIRLHDEITKRAQFLLNSGSPQTQATTAFDHSEQSKEVSMDLPSFPISLKQDIPGPHIVNTQQQQHQEHLLEMPKSIAPITALETVEIPDAHDSAPQPKRQGKSSVRNGALSSNRVRGMLPSGTAFASTFKPPFLPLDDLDPDLSDVPNMERHPPRQQQTSSEDVMFEAGENDDAVHTALMINADQGLTLFIRPEAVMAVAELIEGITPTNPDAIFDRYHFSTMMNLLASLAKSHGQNSIMDIKAKVPRIHLRFDNHYVEDKQGIDTCDRFDLVISNTSLIFREKILPERNLEENSNSLHLTVGSVALSAQQQTAQAHEEPVALRLGIDNILLWLMDSDKTAINGSFNTIECALESREIDYVAKLVFRTAMLGQSIQLRFANLVKAHTDKMRYLIYEIATHGSDVPDPVFLTSPSFVIRSASDHVRNSDSWKIISRLRHLWMQMPESEKGVISECCLKGDTSLPLNSEATVLAELDKWRSWDTVHVKTSFAMLVLYGHAAPVEGVRQRSSIPLGVSVYGGSIKALVDPGDKQSQLSILGLNMALTVTPPPPRTAARLFQDYKEVRSTIVQINAKNTSLQVNWEIIRLVDEIMTLFANADDPQDNDQATNVKDTTTSVKPEAEQELFHVVFSTTSGHVQLDTLNVISTLSADKLGVSACGKGWNNPGNAFNVNVVSRADDAYMHIDSKQKSLMRNRVLMPSFCLDFEVQKDSTASRLLKVVGDSQEILVDLVEEVQGLIEAADSIVDGEVKAINKLIAKHAGSRLQSTENMIKPTTSKKLKANVALFLEKYSVRLALLHDLAYTASGRVARVAVVPDSRVQSMYRIDLDLKEQTHEIRKTPSAKTVTSAAVGFPAINGTVRLLFTEKLTTASGVISIEKIHLDGSSIYHMLGLVSTPQVAGAIEAIKKDALTVSHKVQDILPDSSDDKQTGDALKNIPFIFDGNITLAGLEMTAGIPRVAKSSAATELAFRMGHVQLRAANRAQDQYQALPFPELRVWLGEMALELTSETTNDKSKLCGRALFGAVFTCDVEKMESSSYKRNFKLSTAGPEISITEDTAPVAVAILAHLQQRLKGLDLSMEKKYMHRLQQSNVFKRYAPSKANTLQPQGAVEFISNFSFNLQKMDIYYTIGKTSKDSGMSPAQDLSFTLESISLETRSEKAAMLRVDNLQLQLSPHGRDRFQRSVNSALLPEVKFIVAHRVTKTDRKLRVLAAGKALDLQLDPHFVLPIKALERSITRSVQQSQATLKTLQSITSGGSMPTADLLGDRVISSVIVEASFAGAVIVMQNSVPEQSRRSTISGSDRAAEQGKYGQFTDDAKVTKAVLRAPGIKVNANYADNGARDSTLKVETRIDPSNNTLHPSVVPLVLRVADSIRTIMDEAPEMDTETGSDEPKPQVVAKLIDEEAIIGADPRAILGRTKLNVGFRVCRQQFTLSCQPIAKVAASAQIDDIYIMINTVESAESGNFFSVSASLRGLSASLQHVYSRERTLQVDVESIVLSLMNSKHLNGKSGISAILNINPTKAQINAKQLQDVLLFREIWIPPEMRTVARSSPVAVSTTDPQDYFVHRYHEIAASTNFNWNATVSVTKLSLDLDLGQAIGKTNFDITNLWASSKKASSSQQNLCIGVDSISTDSSGRMSGFIKLQKVKVRTSIAWPEDDNLGPQRPLIQGSIGFDRIGVKAAFDYQAFGIIDVEAFEFIMYNVRDSAGSNEDRLVAILDGDSVNAYCISTSAAQAVALGQAFERLIQEKKASYEQAIKDVERFLRRKGSSAADHPSNKTAAAEAEAGESGLASPLKATSKMPLTLHNDVVVTLRSIDVGAFPGSFFDSQLVRLRASELQARFAVALEDGKIHSGLGLQLGQVSAALAEIPFTVVPKKLGEIGVEEVVKNAHASRGGTILRVPKVVASMQTWQRDASKVIDYIFKSSFEGKIDVGWNYARISYIRGMWSMHARTLASRLGKPLPESALKISGVPEAQLSDEQILKSGEGAKSIEQEHVPKDEPQQKITAVVNLPQSRYTYRALEPAIIETPQLRDMGEATPPLEWIGLHRDRLPNVTHQIVIVTLLGVAKEVEDAYTAILGSAKT